MANRFGFPQAQPEQKPFAATAPGIALNTVTGLPRAALDVGKSVGRSMARSIASAGVTVGKALGGSNEVAGTDIKSPFGRAMFENVFGHEPIKSIEDRIADTEISIKASPFAQRTGLDKAALPLAFSGIMGMTALDLTPYGSLQKNATNALLKETTEAGARTLLANMKVTDDVAARFAPEFARAKTADEVADIFGNMQAVVGAQLADRFPHAPALMRAAHPDLPVSVYKLPEDLKLADAAPDDLSHFVASRTMRDGSKRPAIRQYSRIFAPKEFETFEFRDVGKGLLGGRSFTFRDAAFTFDNLTAKQAAEKGGFGPMVRLFTNADHAYADRTVFALDRASTIRSLAKEHGVKVDKKTGQQLFRALEGATDVPENVARLAQGVRESLNTLREEANVVRRSLGKKDIGFLNNYAPHLQNTSFWRMLRGDTKTEITDNFDFIIPNAKKNPHAIPREGGMDDLETNAWKLLDSYISSIADDLYTSPVIEQLKAVETVVRGRGYSQMSNVIQRYIRENLVGKPGRIDFELGLIEGTTGRAVAQRVNMARNVAALAGNLVWTAFVQPASAALTAARAGGATRGVQNTLGGMVDFVTDRSIREKIKGLPTIVQKTRGSSIAQSGMGDLDRTATRIFTSRIDRYNDVVGKVADAMEYWLTATAASAGYRYANQLGLKGKDADILADLMGGATQSVYTKEGRPFLLNNLAVRSGFPFQTYSFELYRYVKTLVGARGGLPLERSERINQGVMLLAGMWLYNQWSEATTGRTLNTVGSAIPIAGREVERHVIEPVKKATGLPIPTASAGGAFGQAPIAPLQDVSNFIGAFRPFVEHGNIQPLRKELVRWGMGFAGMSGSSTINRFVDGLIAATDGYQRDRTGKRIFKVRGTDKIIAPILGPYSTEAGKSYLQGGDSGGGANRFGF